MVKLTIWKWNVDIDSRISLLFLVIFLMIGLSILYSGIESCNFCPFQHEVTRFLSAMPFFSTGMILFAPVLLMFFSQTTPLWIYIAAGSVYGLLVSFVAGLGYHRYKKNLRSPFIFYFLAGYFPLAAIGIFSFADSPPSVDLFMGLLQLTIYYVGPGLFFSYILSILLLFVMEDLLKQKWSVVSWWRKALVILLVTVVEYGLFRLFIHLFVPQLD